MGSIEEIRQFLSLTSEDNFVVRHCSFSNEEQLKRIASYEKYTHDILSIIACLAYWATDEQLSLLAKIVSRSCDRLLENQSGIIGWLNLRWYPLLLLTYNAGIAAIENGNYRSIYEIFYTKLSSSDYDNKESFFVQKIAYQTEKLIETFKIIPEHERYYTPMSEYFFKQLQPNLDDLFFLGKRYENVFDEFEILFALTIADLQKQEGGNVWGPVGRFGWKNRSYGIPPFMRLRHQASQHKNNWKPIKAGMFGGSYERFEEIAEQYQRKILSQLNWY